jgi:hypothetical protein
MKPTLAVTMTLWLALWLALWLGPGPLASAQAQAGSPQAGKAPAAAPAKDDGHRREDIAKHRQMARAHEEAARCLESGEKESACQERLREACKGVGVGRYCGMRHSH